MKEYKQDQLIVTWDSKKCIHSGKCVRGLPAVFKPKEQPWIKIGMATQEEIMQQINQCPSKALGYRVDS